MGNTNINREHYKDIFLASMGVRYDINKKWNINAAFIIFLIKVLPMHENHIKAMARIFG